MLFNSTLFLIYLPSVVYLYYRMTPQYRRYLILLASYCFYWIWSIPFSSLLVISTVIDYYAAKLISTSKKRHWRTFALICSLVSNLGILCLFKYVDFFSDSYYSIFGYKPWGDFNWVLPLGISFYTFQTMSYTIDVYRGTTTARKSLLDVALYVSFFPQLVAGPIVRSEVLIPQLVCNSPFDWLNIKKGVSLVIWGLIKKVFFADPMAYYVNLVYADPASFTSLSVLLATYAFAVQIYCDFSAYSDIAIGSAKMLGIDLPINFNAPYLSCTMRDFWRRWHISLSSWLRDYLYITFGGNRKGRFRTYLNLMMTMLLGGLWHGAGWNWVVWGGLQGFYLSFERFFSIEDATKSAPFVKVFRWFITLHLACFSWIFFRSNSVSQSFEVIGHIFELSNLGIQISLIPMLYLFIVLGMEFINAKKHVTEYLVSNQVALRWVTYAAFVIFIMTFRKATNPEFIYFQF